MPKSPNQKLKLLYLCLLYTSGWHTLARHAVAVSELIGLERQGKLTGPLEKRICQLTTEDEEEALAREIKKKSLERK